MKHLGDITKIDGSMIDIPDVVVGGSPCQDLSVAGQRKGLSGERSGLFMEQIRLIKELRENDRRKNGRTGINIRPRYMVWENVPGAFSSNKSEDFRIVLEETARVVEEDAVIPRPPKDKWSNAGAIVGDGWSIAWRVLDAQFWGVPQRRRRISLIADFGGQSAPEILFVRKGLYGDINEGDQEREETSCDARRGTQPSDSAFTMQIRCGCEGGGKGALIQEEKSATLSCNNVQTLFQPVLSIDMGGSKSSVAIMEEQSPTLTCTHHGTPAVIYSGNGNAYGDKTGAIVGDHENRVTDFTSIVVEPVCYRKSDLGNYTETEQSITLKNSGDIGIRYIVRRLTPEECELLQGYPKGYTNIGEYINSKGRTCKTNDTARYKALGNSIALPPWRWVMKRICSQYERNATLGSLFDGIGGFPLIWESINGQGSCLWASEIEEFPIAVTKQRIGG